MSFLYDAAAEQLWSTAVEKEAELKETKAKLEESFDCEQQRLLKSCRQHMQEERSELLTRVKAREERVSATISHCQRKSELELERRLALLAAQEKSAKEAVRQREQIEQQAQEIRRLQQQLRRSDSEPKLKDVSDMKWRRQVRRTRSSVGERTIRAQSRGSSLTLLEGRSTPSTCSSTPAGDARKRDDTR
ncbi:unnamed protein product [Durusdinium trenchii]|uniref:Uncharacterized protein n=1 Tax=Durusdinium trenchii TaxID=1381693 RepID=A0ABP0S2L2_9DINO